MIQFGKYFQSQKKQEWIDNYIDYGVLKQLIKDLASSFKEQEDGTEFCDELHRLKQDNISPEKDTNSSPYNLVDDPLEKILKTNKGKFVKLFLDAVEREINKFYLFFIVLENKINKTITEEIFIEQEEGYENFLDDLFKSLERLEKICKSIIELSKFVNLNVTAITLILKKFDEQFSNTELPVSFFFLQSKLKSANSSLVYVLQFKTIDESSAILDDLSTKLKKKFDNAFSRTNEQEVTNMLGESLLKNIQIDKLGRLDKNQINSVFIDKYNKLKQKIEEIDDSNQMIRTNVDIWSIMARENIKMVNDLYTRGKTSGVSYLENEKILENLTKNVKTNVKYDKKKLSVNNFENVRDKQFNRKYDYASADLKNNINIWLLLVHTLLYTMNQYVVLPTNFLLIRSLGYNEYWTGIVLAVTPLGSIIGQTMYIKIQSSYKVILFFSCLSFIFGNLLYTLSNNFDSILIMIVSRFFIGLGGARSVIRRYFHEQLPNERLSLYSFYYIALVYIGIALGPALGLLGLVLPDLKWGFITISFYTYSGFIPMIIWILFTLIFLICYNEFVGMTIKETGEADLEIREDRILANDISKINNTLPEQQETRAIIKKEINVICEKQNAPFSDINRSYFTLVLHFLLIRVTIENLLIFAPVYMILYHQFNVAQVCLFLILTSLMIIPVSLFINNWFMLIEERKMIATLLLISLFLLIYLSFMHLSLHVYYSYFVVYSLILININILETYVSCVYSKIISSKISGYSGLIIICCTTGGKVIGCLLVSIFIYYREENHKIAWNILAVLFLVITTITLYNYKYLKVTAVSRILKKRDFMNLN